MKKMYCMLHAYSASKGFAMKYTFSLVALSATFLLPLSVRADVLSDEKLVEWTVISPGIQKRITEKGELVHAYRGKEGISAILLEKKRELRMAEAAGDAATADSLVELIADLEWLHKESGFLGYSNGMAKINQTVEVGPYIPQVCGFLNSGTASFSLRQSGLWDIVSVKTYSPAFGAAIQFGPPAPLPISVYRSVVARVKNLSNASQPVYSDYKRSFFMSNPIEIEVGAWAGVNNCHMEAVHIYAATCASSNQSEGAVVTTEQTCANLRHGYTPVISY